MHQFTKTQLWEAWRRAYGESEDTRTRVLVLKISQQEWAEIWNLIASVKCVCALNYYINLQKTKMTVVQYTISPTGGDGEQVASSGKQTFSAAACQSVPFSCNVWSEEILTSAEFLEEMTDWVHRLSPLFT